MPRAASGLAVAAALVSGALVALQTRVNASLERSVASSVLAALVSFIMTALVLYLAVVKPYEMYKSRRGITDEKTATETELLAEIRDLLAGR